MASTIVSYHNILDDRRQQNTYLWAARKLNPLLSYKHDKKLTPQQLMEDVLNSNTAKELIQTLVRQGNSPNVAKAFIWGILKEIGFNKNTFTLRILSFVLTKICTRIYKGIYVNEIGIERLKSRMGNTPVIFCPSHRSYGDFILTSYVCFTYNIVIPCTAAGMDFHAMWGMGKMLRDTGAFFMRRSYNDDAVYWETFKEYFQEIISKGEIPINFFIEGTRSRVGKSLPPKFGLLSQVIKAFVSGKVPDVLLVPINMSYERLLEEKLFSYELLGVPKPKESTSGLVKSMRILKEQFGSIYITLGEPISLREYSKGKIDRSNHNFEQNVQLNESERQLSVKLGYDLISIQEKLGVVTAFNIIAIILNNNLISLKQTHINKLYDEFIWVKEFLTNLGAVVCVQDIREAINESLQVHQKLVYAKDDLLTLVEENLDFRSLNASKLKGHLLSSEIMNRGVNFIALQLYVNHTLHYTVPLSIIVTILTNFHSKDLRANFYIIRELLSRDFVTIVNRNSFEFEATLSKLHELGIVKGDSLQLNSSKEAELLHNSLKPFLIAYYVVLLVLNKVENCVDERTVLVNSQKFIQQLIENKNGFVYYYSLTLDTLLNCINSLVNMSIISRDKSNRNMLMKNDESKLSVLTTLLRNCLQVDIEMDFEPIECALQLTAKL